MIICFRGVTYLTRPMQGSDQAGVRGHQCLRGGINHRENKVFDIRIQGTCWSIGSLIMAANRSVVKPGKRSRGVTITPKYRVQEFPDEGLRASDYTTLYCDTCGHSLDWRRRNTIADHIVSLKHKSARQKFQESQLRRHQQQSIQTYFSGREKRDVYVRDLVTVVTSSGAPIELIDKLKPFLKKHSPEGGAIPSADSIRKHRIPKMFEEHKQQLKDILRNKYIFVAFDETTDRQDRSVLNIVARKYKTIANL